ncbi:MAG: hypothetical protein IT324_30145 [Anaerolineae bacterium]|nr:hypothetical protein [Anaerolineae bacterium]
MQVQREAERQLTATSLIGPAPAFFGRIDNVYHWHILVNTDPVLLWMD